MMRHPQYSRRQAVALGSASLLAAGLSGIGGARGADDPALVAAARAEGRVTVYADADADPGAVDRLLRLFGQDYGIATDLQRLAESALAQRFTAESESGRHTADLVILGDALFARQAMAKAWLTKVTDLPAMAAWPQSALRGGLVPLNVNPYVLSWNTSMTGGRLTSFEVLNDPRVRGKVVVGDPRALAAARLWFAGMLQKFGTGFLRELGTHAVFAPNSAVGPHHLAAGNVAIYAPAMPPSINSLIQQGASVNFALCDPIVIGQTLAAVAAKAPHPAAARLLLNYWMTPDGQATFSRGSYTMLEGVPGKSVLANFVEVDPEVAERELTRIVVLLNLA